MVNIAFNFIVVESIVVWSGVVYAIEKLVGSRMYDDDSSDKFKINDVNK